MPGRARDRGYEAVQVGRRAGRHSLVRHARGRREESGRAGAAELLGAPEAARLDVGVRAGREGASRRIDVTCNARGRDLGSVVADVRARLSIRLQEPDLHARLLGRTVMGNLVIDHEIVTRNFPEGLGTIEMIAMYEVSGDRIGRGWFKFGEKRMGALA